MKVTLDLRECPMILAELAKVPVEARRGQSWHWSAV
jgi:hypothetical protein